jgi:MFS family permease
MSIGAMTTLAAARDAGKPTKQDVGKSTSGEAEEPASLTDILVTQVPTELVAPYTAVTAAIVGAVGTPSKAVPNPDQLAGWRWLAFAILIVATVILIWEGKRRKSQAQDNPFPLLEVTGAVVAATGWAFALPGSPLIPYLHGTSQVLAPLIIAFAAVAATAMTASALQAPRDSAKANTESGGSGPIKRTGRFFVAARRRQQGYLRLQLLDAATATGTRMQYPCIPYRSAGTGA